MLTEVEAVCARTEKQNTVELVRIEGMECCRSGMIETDERLWRWAARKCRLGRRARLPKYLRVPVIAGAMLHAVVGNPCKRVADRNIRTAGEVFSYWSRSPVKGKEGGLCPPGSGISVPTRLRYFGNDEP